MEIKKQSKMGRPRTPEYRKIRHRMSKVEDTFTEVLNKMESENDRKLIIEALEKLKVTN